LCRALALIGPERIGVLGFTEPEGFHPVRYYFHIRDGSEAVCDEEGMEFSSIEEARIEARASARDLLMEDLRCEKSGDGRTLEISDKFGSIIEIMNVRDVLH
jgi:hypothetical protein